MKAIVVEMAATATRNSQLRAVTLILVVPLWITACATLNEAQCETANWQDLGQRNGQQGRPASYVAEHEKACSGYGLPVDSTAWRAGWETGIRQYCTVENGLQVGRDGAHYAQSCPADVAPGFLRGYTVGERVHAARVDRDLVRDAIDSLTTSIVDASDATKRSDLQTQLLLKQTELMIAEARLLDAERAADAILYSSPTY